MTIRDTLVRTIKLLIPAAVVRWRARRLHTIGSRRQAQEFDRLFSGKSPREAFAMIYEKAMWGSSNAGGFYSGAGSHDPLVVSQYVEVVGKFLGGFASKPDVVDLGCGDFNIGAQLRPFCGRYIACDVVPALIERNRLQFADMKVDFRCIDITSDQLPAADVIVVRQVLQHLSNAHISRFLQRLPHCAYLVVTEHYPATSEFPSNIDKPIGAGTRMDRHMGPPSGVVLTDPPFNLSVAKQSVVSESDQFGGTIRTWLYEMPRGSRK